MKEGPKTLAFVAAAVLLLGAAWWSNSGPVGDSNEADATGKLYPDFKDPLAAKSLEIIAYDEDTGTVEPFKVAQVKGLWSIPSHSDYPADAAKQLADAATSMMDLDKLDIASRDPSEHALYGVVDPKAANLAAGATGVGKRVTLRDGSDNVLADYILGSADPKQAGVRYVRIPNQDPVYRVSVSVDKLSTRFGDWIEKDLLKMNAFDVKQAMMDNYSVDELNRRIKQESRVIVDFDSKDSKWTLGDMKVFRGKAWQDVKLGPDEELNSEKLNDLKNALDELQIVDVARKPAGLAADLQVDEKAIKESGMINLIEHGFYPASLDGKTLEIVSNEGEVHCGMNDGVEYVLRFGEIAGADKEAKDKEKGKDEKKDAKAAGAAVNRYIMVTARFNKSLLDEPDLEDLPELPVKAGPAEPAKKPETKTDEKAKQPASKKETPPKKEPAAKEEKKEEPPAGDSCGADDAKAVPAEKEAAEKKPEAPKDPIVLERERIEKENKRKQEEFDTKVKEGEKKVKDLNARFASWYYIISNATYDKIHLTRDQLIKKKEAPKTEGDKPGEPAATDPFLQPGAVEKFNELKSQGLPK